MYHVAAPIAPLPAVVATAHHYCVSGCPRSDPRGDRTAPEPAARPAGRAARESWPLAWPTYRILATRLRPSFRILAAREAALPRAPAAGLELARGAVEGAEVEGVAFLGRRWQLERLGGVLDDLPPGLAGAPAIAIGLAVVVVDAGGGGGVHLQMLLDQRDRALAVLHH